MSTVKKISYLQIFIIIVSMIILIISVSTGIIEMAKASLANEKDSLTVWSLFFKPTSITLQAFMYLTMILMVGVGILQILIAMKIENNNTKILIAGITGVLSIIPFISIVSFGINVAIIMNKETQRGENG